MAYQGSYPSIDQSGLYQPYAPAPSYSPYSPSNQPPLGYYEGGIKHELNQPLIANKKSSKNAKSQNRRTIALLILIICFSIEVAGVVYSLYYNYLFEYCYWDFNFYSYKADADMTLASANYKGNIYSLYDEFNCTGQSLFPECPGLCDLVSDAENRKKWTMWALDISGGISIISLMVFLSSCACRKPKLKKGVAAVLLIASYIAFVTAVVVYVLTNGFYYKLDELEESNIEGKDDPMELDFKDGGKYLIGLLVYMLVYRIIVISIIK